MNYSVQERDLTLIQEVVNIGGKILYSARKRGWKYYYNTLFDIYNIDLIITYFLTKRVNTFSTHFEERSLSFEEQDHGMGFDHQLRVGHWQSGDPNSSAKIGLIFILLLFFRYIHTHVGSVEKKVQ